jgi:hypothetical protein
MAPLPALVFLLRWLAGQGIFGSEAEREAQRQQRAELLEGRWLAS